MVGPPSSWSLRDQEDEVVGLANRPYVGPFTRLDGITFFRPSPDADMRLRTSCAFFLQSDRLLLPSLPTILPAVSPCHSCRSPTIGPRGWLRSGGEMLFKIAFALLAAWLLGLLGSIGLAMSFTCCFWSADCFSCSLWPRLETLPQPVSEPTSGLINHDAHRFPSGPISR